MMLQTPFWKEVGAAVEATQKPVASLVAVLLARVGEAVGAQAVSVGARQEGHLGERLGLSWS